MRALSLRIFTTGFVTLGVELSASRLLEPAFGNNQIVWASIIGLILLCLAIGAWLGGKLADRFPRSRELDLTLTAAALAVALIPVCSRPVLRWATVGLSDFALGPLFGSLLVLLLLFSIPGVLLGAASPWAVRLALTDAQHAGRVTGRLYAIGTTGSLLGAFLPVLWLIPAFGTRWTFFLLALALLAVLVAVTLAEKHRWAPLLALLVVLALAWLTLTGATIRAAWDDGRTGELIFEDESVYNYIAVRQWGSERHLKLNDGIGIHSVYHPDMLLSQGIWDYFLLAPWFGPGAALPPQLNADSAATSGSPRPLANLLILGLAAGTVSELFSDIYGAIPITGVELDPEIIQVGERYFEMTQPNLTAVAADARAWLTAQPATAAWDMIAVDAYRPPYIPFHLTTVEFFQLVHSHLSADGVLAINVGRTATNYALVDLLAATAGQVFPTVFLVDEPGPADTLGNSLLVATRQPMTVAAIAPRLRQLPADLPPELRDFARRAADQVRMAPDAANAAIFTDDRAPVEWVVHGMIVDFLTHR